MPAAEARAELIADRGAATVSADFFRSRPFLDAEGVTHSLRIESAARTTLLPLLVREIPLANAELDAISPYAYPGGRVEGDGAPPQPTAIDWSATGLVSVFVRERIGTPVLGGARERSRLQIYDPSRPRRLRPRLAEQVRAAQRLGWTIERLDGPGAGSERIAEFIALYEQTMRRTGAAERYRFAPDYYPAILRYPESWLLVARSPRGESAAAAIMALSDGYLHYYLGGTGDRFLGDSPFKSVVAAMLDLADELALPLNLGGGVRPGDGLERFKRGFANAELPFFTDEIVADPAAYERLAAGVEAGGFFPAYRAPR